MGPKRRSTRKNLRKKEKINYKELEEGEINYEEIEERYPVRRKTNRRKKEESEPEQGVEEEFETTTKTRPTRNRKKPKKFSEEDFDQNKEKSKETKDVIDPGNERKNQPITKDENGQEPKNVEHETEKTSEIEPQKEQLEQIVPTEPSKEQKSDQLEKIDSDEEILKKGKNKDEEFILDEKEEEETEDDIKTSEEDFLEESEESPRYKLRSKKKKKTVEDQKGYNFRPRIEIVQTPEKNQTPEKKEKKGKDRKREKRKFNSSSSEEDNKDLLPINIDRSADIDPILIDDSITWESIGGLHNHIESLKEMIMLPLLYPEVFQRFNITPPKGVLFFGPPGTGKTLTARALANTCSKTGQPVAFFMRKGADILSKYVGEAEKQLRLLFQEARKRQPSIIFFDEIDGLAPTRSVKNDQHTASIVSTLLALMDGLDSRGNVIVIGATNRIDSIDPALRRPGRFDRELIFTLPSKSGRKEILDIHTKTWEPQLSKEIKEWICEKTVGYCGADIKALCTEAALNSLKRTFPQVYQSQEKLILDTKKIIIEKEDFIDCMKKIVPSTHRSSIIHSRPLPYHLYPLFEDKLIELKKIFKKEKSLLYRPWLIIHGDNSNLGQNDISKALLYEMEEYPIYSIGMPTLLSSYMGREEALITNFAEARKNVPSILWIPDIDEWWNKSTDLMKSSLITMMNDIPSTVQVLILASSNINIKELPTEIQNLFANNEYEVKLPELYSKEKMFHNLKEEIMKIPRENKPIQTLPKLSKAPKKIAENVNKLQKKKDEALLLELRIQLRDLVNRVLKNKEYEVFVKTKDLFSIYDIDEKINQYTDTKMFLKDFYYFVENGSKYADEINSKDIDLKKRILIKAKHLYDIIRSLIKEGSNFPRENRKKWKEITKRRAQEKEKLSEIVEIQVPIEVEKEVEVIIEDNPSLEIQEKKDIIFDKDRYEELFKEIMIKIKNYDVLQLDKLYCEILFKIQEMSEEFDKTPLLEILEKMIG